ncbi:hypothetical protein GJ496_000703 [Pomphorhynchus laevis]|nr:hypothetical protein GJ496_000703 [Pomphorhynchus laevis]
MQHFKSLNLLMFRKSIRLCSNITSQVNSNLTANSIPSSSIRPKYEHDSPFRDFVNYPPEVLYSKAGEVRFGFIPNEWFQIFYPKTGVTGPYLFGYGLLTLILSKEFYVFWMDANIQLCVVLTTILLTKYAGPKIKAFLQKFEDDKENIVWALVDKKRKQVEADISKFKQLENMPEVTRIIGEAKRECVSLQQEFEYRKRLDNWADQINRRLKYIEAVEDLKIRIHREQLVGWIVNEVKRAFDAKERDAYFNGCIQHLQQLASLQK